jgi:nucleoside-diphosphate-sugar epimerase
MFGHAEPGSGACSRAAAENLTMVLLTGANGHLGANLLRRLLADGEQIRVFLRTGSDNSTVDGLAVERVYGDLRDFESVRAAVRGCSHIYHCAAKVSTLDSGQQELFESNVLGTRHVLLAALEHNVRKVVVSGSFSATGYDLVRPSDETFPFNPFLKHLPYGMTKAFVEHECLKAAAEGLDVVVAVSCAILGPNDFKPSRMGRVLCDVANRRMRAYIPGGFEFVSARDIVAGHILAMQKGRSGQKYILSSEFLTVDDLMTIFEEVTGQPRPPLRLPAPMMAFFAEASNFVLNFFPEVPRRFTPAAVRILRMHRRADIGKARRELGYEPTPIVDAVREAYDWFVERRAILRPKAVSLAGART